MIQRRKATTYGRSSRKPITDFSAFAQASEPTIEHGHQRYNVAKAATTGGTALKVVQRSAVSKTPSKGREAVPSELRRPTDSGHRKAQSNVALYDFPSSDEDDERSASTSDNGSRKRRKLTPMNDDPSTSLVFDDDSLQRHIAAEVREESLVAAHVTNQVVATPKGPLTYVRGNTKVSKQKKLSPIITRRPTSSNRPGLDATRSPKTPELKSSIAETAVSPKNHDNRDLMQKTPPRKTQGTRKSSAQFIRDPYTPPKNNALPTLSARGRSESKQPQNEQGPTSSTPPRPRSSAGVATTPRQRELWGKLLSNDTHFASPSILDIPELRIADQKEQPRKSTLKSQMQTSGKAANMGTGKRSARLVDFLITSDRDRSPSEAEFSEENGSSGAEQSKFIQSDVSINDDVLTTQTSPSAGSQSRRLQTHDPELFHNSQPISSLQGAPKVTYIRERTHLGDGDLNDAAMLDAPLVSESGASRKRQWAPSGVAQPKHDSDKDIFDGLDDGQDSQRGTMRSIHELRKAGGNTRIVGELEGILDDLDERLGSSISARRSSLMNLTSKLLEASTCRMLVDQGLEPRLLAQVNFGHDIIERSLLAAAITQILFHTTSAAFLTQTHQVKTTNLLVGLLGQTQDLTKEAKLRETNMSKLAQSEYSILCSSFLRSPLWRILKPQVLSGQILALQGLELLVRQAREAGSLAEILSADAISYLAKNTIPPSEALQPPTSSSKICLELAVSILESSTISGAADIQDSEWNDVTLERISDIFPVITDASSHEFGNLQALTLRLYLNLTNTNPHLCETFSKPPLVRAIFKTMYMQFHRLAEPNTQDQDLSLLDNLVLSLGCLINLAESSNTMRQLVMDLKTQEDSFLEVLLQLFVKKRGEAAEVR